MGVTIILHILSMEWWFTITLSDSGELSLPPFLYITYMIINIYYPVEQVNINIQSLINIIQENNRVITTKKG